MEEQKLLKDAFEKTNREHQTLNLAFFDRGYRAGLEEAARIAYDMHQGCWEVDGNEREALAMRRVSEAIRAYAARNVSPPAEVGHPFLAIRYSHTLEKLYPRKTPAISTFPLRNWSTAT